MDAEAAAGHPYLGYLIYNREHKNMTFTHTIVAHFPSHSEAETVVRELQQQGFDMQKLSIVGKDYQTAEHVQGFLSWKDTAKAGAAGGGYWGSFVGGVGAIDRLLLLYSTKMQANKAGVNRPYYE